MGDYRKIPEEQRNRPAAPKGNWFDKRTKRIYENFWRWEDLLTPELTRRVFLPNKAYTSGKKRAEDKLRHLYRAGLIHRPEKSEMSMYGGLIYWRFRKPKISEIFHTLTINDFHLLVTEACDVDSELELIDWQPSLAFKGKLADVVKHYNPSGQPIRKGYEPDSYFQLLFSRALSPQEQAQYNAKYEEYDFRFLLEIDTGSEQNWRVYEEKILLGHPYISSPVYKKRFGDNSGRMLIVTRGKGGSSGERRLELLKLKTEAFFNDERAEFYLFTTFDRVAEAGDIVRDPIWDQGGHVGRVNLLEE